LIDGEAKSPYSTVVCTAYKWADLTGTRWQFTCPFSWGGKAWDDARLCMLAAESKKEHFFPFQRGGKTNHDPPSRYCLGFVYLLKPNPEEKGKRKDWRRAQAKRLRWLSELTENRNCAGRQKGRSKFHEKKMRVQKTSGISGPKKRPFTEKSGSQR